MAVILAIDDDRDLLHMIRRALKKDGHEVLTADHPDLVVPDWLDRADLILLDIMMPGTDGLEYCQAIRREVLCPILFLSARSEDEMIVDGLGRGGDDYLTKPFSLQVLRSRVQAHLRREGRAYLLMDSGWTLDLHKRTVLWQGQAMPFTRSEQEIVTLLIKHPGRVFSKEQLLDRINGWEKDSGPAAITEHMKNIRNKCRRVGQDPVETVWGIGYRWKKEARPLR